jgi:general secretion pathway protein D
MRFSIVVINILIFNGCVQHQDKIILPPIVQKTKTLEKVKTDDTYSDNQPYEDSFYTQGNNDALEKISKPFEQIPDFQKNDFKSLQTAEKKTYRKNIIVKGKSVKVNVESIPLNEFINFIFSSVLKVNYTVDKNIKGLIQPITLNMAEPLPKQQLFDVVEKILKDESISLVKENGTIFIKQINEQIIQNDLSDRYIVFGRKLSPNIADNKKVIMFVPYSYMNPKDSFNILRKLGITNVNFSYLENNIQILDGEASSIRQTLEMINIIDSPSMEKKTPYLIEFENIEVQKFKQRIETILTNNAIPLASTINDIGVVLNPIDELNSLLVLSPKKSWLDMILFWKEKLDVLSEVSDVPQLYMYSVKYRKADEFATILQNVLPQNGMVNAGITPVENINNKDESNRIEGINNSSTPILGNQATIKADLHTNSLMMNVTSAQYKQILPIIKKLDKLPLQVLVEVTLAEVDITNNFNLGFEWTLLNNKALSGTSTQQDGAHTATLGGAAGITSSLFKTNLTSVINAFAEDKVLDILSRPSLMILNNKTGNINVGQQVPVVSSEVSGTDVNTGATNTPSVLRNISYTNTGITVNLTPTINSNGTLTLDVSVTLSEASSNSTSNIDSPLIINRQVSTSIVMHSDDSVLLGGLISHNKSNGNSGVPLLKDLPLVGDVFKSQSKSHRKTELIILLHPKIIGNRVALQNETEKFIILLRNLKNL